VVDTIWQQFLSIANKEIGSRTVETWFKAIYIHRWDHSSKTAYLYSPNQFIKEWICNHYLLDLELHLARLFCVPTIAVIIQVKPTEKDAIASSVSAKIEEKLVPAKKINSQSILNEEYQFHSFVVDQKNEFAFLAAQAIIEKPGDLYSPFFICGKSGVGKTHLLHAIGNQYLAQNKKSTVLFCPIDRFINEFVQSIRSKSMEKFNQKYNKVDLLLVDDLQDIAYKEQSQDVLCHIVNNFNELKKQIVFSSIVEPHSLHGITEKLRSRLSSGLITNLFHPTIDTKIAIIKKKISNNQNSVIPDDLISIIAHKSNCGIRDIEGILIKITALASLTQKPIDFELVQKVLSHEKIIVDTQPIAVKQIFTLIKDLYALDSIEQLTNKKRDAYLTHIRHIAIYITKKVLKKSLRETAVLFGNRDHTTIKHAFDKIEGALLHDKNLQSQIQMLEKSLLSSTLSSTI
jgi:chromosomal replication initiator protein